MSDEIIFSVNFIKIIKVLLSVIKCRKMIISMKITIKILRILN